MFSKLIKVYQHDFTALKFSAQFKRYLTINVLMFAIPLVLGQPQLLIGSIVNFALVYIALNFKKAELLPAIFLPAVAALLHGVIWGPMTPVLAILMPLVWLGNAVLVFGIRELRIRKVNLTLSLLIPGLLKIAVLFIGANVLVNALHLPAAIIQSMGLLQLYTFAIGAVTYLLFAKLSHNK